MQKKIVSLQGLRWVLFLLIYFFHASVIGNITQTQIYRTIFAGGSCLSVSMFFILSGFVEGMKNKEPEKYFFNAPLRFIKKVYLYHLLFLLASLPMNILSIVQDPVKKTLSLIVDIFLLKSWIPEESFWLGSFNGVAWFLSTLLFLKILDKPLRSMVLKNPSMRSVKTLIMVCIAVEFLIAMIPGINVRYWLYAFPFARMPDYIVGFMAGYIFQNKALESEKADNPRWCNGLEMLAVVWLLMFPYIPEAFRRAAVFLPAGIFAIYIFALDRGIFSTILSSPYLVRFGNHTFYYMMCHQIILRYVSIMDKKVNFHMNQWFLALICLVITCVSRSFSDWILEKIIRRKKE